MLDYTQQQFNQKDTTFCKAYQGDYGQQIKKIWAEDYVCDPFMSMFFGYNDMDNCISWYLAKCTDGAVRDYFKPPNPDPQKYTKIIKEVGKYLGACKVGVCELKPYMVYSHKAQRVDTVEGNWGEPVDLLNRHQYAISMMFPLNHNLMNASPSFIDEAEIGIAYQKAALMCCQLAGFIRECGYSAMGHHHRRDYVIHVPIAIEAGLGELGRLGYLITPEYGPCVRITTVTTDMPLIPDHPVDYGIDYFCQICKKCAKNCPSKAIPEEKTVTRGFKKWQVDADSCFKYWLSSPQKHFGCAVCMKSCPWNQKDSWYHPILAKLVQIVPAFAHILLFFDDLLYGKYPHYNVKWIDYQCLNRDVDEINAKGGSVYIKSR